MATRAITRRTDAIALGSERDSVPVVALAASERPVVAVTANIHGDEVTGVAAVHALDELLRSSLRAGTVVLYPSLNPRGLVSQQRTQPVDGVDLNRVFPGDPQSQGASRLAGLLWADLLARSPDAVIDLHADSAVAIPYAIVDRATTHRGEARTRMDRAVLAMAEASGLTVLHEYPEDQYVRFRLDRSLAGAMVNHANVPALTLEIGPRRAVDPRAVRQAVAAVARILAHLGLADPPPPASRPRAPGGPWRRAAAPRVQSAGVFEPSLLPGDAFTPGDVLGVVRPSTAPSASWLHAELPGIVISWSETAWVDARAVPGTLGLRER
ncbi:MAG: succinylglutamate desuccinylase/aspartoacylase family protein [Myxococcota bacterium]